MIVTEFSKKTGDYSALSATDIKVIALTYQLEVESNGCEHLKTEPTIKKTIVVSPKPPGPTKVETVAGFYMPKSNGVDKLAEDIEGLSVQCQDPEGESQESVNVDSKPTNQDNSQDIKALNTEKMDEKDESNEDKTEDDDNTEEDEDEEDDEEEDEEDDEDGGGWITPGNIQQVKNSMAGVTETVTLEVACLTTDFAMQVRCQLQLNIYYY